MFRFVIAFTLEKYISQIVDFINGPVPLVCDLNKKKNRGILVKVIKDMSHKV